MSGGQTPTTPSASMPASSTTPLQATWYGFVGDTREALILFEAVLQGILHRVTRRPHDRERPQLIRSGSVFIYEEGASGIKRWTDGVSWSPSRILGNFLIYRELEKPFPPGEKKRAKPKVKQQSSSEDGSIKQEGIESPLASSAAPHSATASPSVKSDSEKDSKRALVGSLTESYNFKDPGGLVKKTMSVNVNGSHFHLVSYYDPDDVQRGALHRPMDHETLKYIRVRNELIHRQNFRAPIDDADDGSMQNNPSWAQPAPPQQQNPYLAGGAPTHAAFIHQHQQQQQEYLQRSGQSMPGTMSPPSSSYHAHQWPPQHDPRNSYPDHRYPMSGPSPVSAQNSYLTQMPQMSSSMQMRNDFSQYSPAPFGVDRYQQHYQDQQPSQGQPPLYGQQYSTHGSPMQSPPTGQAWPPR